MLELMVHLVDFGMVVLLWLVQWIIYPSFQMIDAAKLHAWHQTYVSRVSFLVIPMVVVQLTGWLVLIVQDPSVFGYLGLMLLTICCLLTFFISVPLHTTIQRGGGTRDILARLVATNWYRTICWNLVFLLGFVA